MRDGVAELGEKMVMLDFAQNLLCFFRGYGGSWKFRAGKCLRSPSSCSGAENDLVLLRLQTHLATCSHFREDFVASDA